MVRVKVDIGKWDKRLDRIQKKLDTLPWQEAAWIVQQSVGLNFDTGGRWGRRGKVIGGTKKWIPRKVSASHRILRDSGKLQGSIYARPHKNGFSVGSELEYAAVHNFGYPEGKITARPFLVVQKEDLTDIKVLMASHITS